MSALGNLDGVQIFFLAFLTLSLPVYVSLLLWHALPRRQKQAREFIPAPASGPRQAFEADAYEPASAQRTVSTVKFDPGPVLPLERTSKLAASEFRSSGAAREANLPRRAQSAVASLGPDAVQIALNAPAHVRGNRHFEISVDIESLIEAPEARQGASPEPAAAIGEPLIAEITPRSRVGLILECLPAPDSAGREERLITIDAPYQVLSWGSRPLTVLFSAHSGPVQATAKANMLLWVAAQGVELGTIEFDIAVDGEAGRTSLDVPILKNTVSAATGTATLFQHAFVAYCNQDGERIAGFTALLDATRLKYRAGAWDLNRLGEGLNQTGRWLQNADIVYILWSAAAATSPEMQQELELIRSEQIMRRLQRKAGKSRKLRLCVVRLDDCPIEPPGWIYDGGGYAKAIEAFKAKNWEAALRE